MAVIYLKHPLHGAKVAIAEEEAVADEKNGWTRYDAGVLLTPKGAYTAPTPAPVSAALDVSEAVPQRRRRKEQTV